MHSLWGQLAELVEYCILWWHWKLFCGRLSEQQLAITYTCRLWKSWEIWLWKQHVCVHAQKTNKIITHIYCVHIHGEIVPLSEEIATPGQRHLCLVACLESCPPPKGGKSPISACHKHWAESENTSRSCDLSAPVVAELSATFSLLSSWVSETADHWELSTICKSHID